MLAIVSRDLVAAEGHYHRSCYRSYTRQEKVTGSGRHAEDSADEYEKALSYSYDELFMKIVAMSDLTSHFVTAMRTCGIDQVKVFKKAPPPKARKCIWSGSTHLL